MPTYEYRCIRCDHEFERVQKITADPLSHCPACKSARAKRQVSRTSFVLKGRGWAAQGYGG